jgi:tight adherence protein B
MRSPRVLIGLAVALAALTVAGSAAGAVRIKRVALGSYPFVRVTVLTSGKSNAPTLWENGRPAPFLTAFRLQAKSVVLAVDSSRAMRGTAFDEANAAVGRIVAGKPNADRLALFAFGSKSLQLTPFATDTIDAQSALRSLTVDGGEGTKLYDTVVRASLALNNTPRPRVLILLTNGRDDSSSGSLEDAIDAAKRAEVAVYPIGMNGKQLDAEALQKLAGETGGTYYSAQRGLAFLDQAYARIATELKRTWILTYYTKARPGDEFHLVAKAGKLGSSVAAVAIPTGEGATPEKGTWIGNLRTHWWGALLIGFVFTLILLGLVHLAFRKPREVWLRERLEPWKLDDPEADTAGKGPRAKAEELAAPVFLATERRFSDLRFWGKLQRVLEQSNAGLRTVHVFYLSLGAGFGLALIAGLAGASPVLVVVLFTVGALGPYLYFAHRASKRLQAFEDQLPEALNAMASSLKAGHSFRQAMQTIVEEGGAPIDVEFSRVLTEARLGRPIEVALADMGRRISSHEFDFALRTVVVQQQVGGSLAGLFEILAETLTRRKQFRKKVKALTAQGRLSALLLIGLPFAIGVLISITSPGYLTPLFTTGTGQFLIVLGLVMLGIGSIALRRITTFKGYR